MHGQSLVVDAGCATVYSYMEALHSGLQILLAVSVGSGTWTVGLFYLGAESGPFLCTKVSASISCKKVEESQVSSTLESVLVTGLLL